MNQRANWLAHVGAVLTVCLWGTTFVSSKVLLNHGLPPADIFFFRFVVAYGLMLLACHRQLLANNWRHELAFVGLGLTGGSIYFLAENMALLHTATSNVSILISSCLLITAFLVGTFYKEERMRRRQIFGSLVAFVGMALVVLNGQLILKLSPLGDLLAILGACMWALYSLLMSLLKDQYSPLFITRKVFFYGILTIIPYFLFVQPLTLNTEMLSQPVVAANLIWLGAVASTGGYLLWNWVLSRLSTVQATNYIYGQPLVTMLAAYLILGERITWMAIAGTLILIFGMARALRN